MEGLENGPKVTREVAEAEFVRFFEAMDLRLEDPDLDEEDRKSFNDNRRTFLEAVERGVLVVNENGEPVFTPAEGSPITFYEPTGATIMAMDRIKKGHDIKRSYAVMSEQTKTPIARFTGMKQREFKVCEAVFILFLQAR
jgi:hypothetical protein